MVLRRSAGGLALALCCFLAGRVSSFILPVERTRSQLVSWSGMSGCTALPPEREAWIGLGSHEEVSSSIKHFGMKLGASRAFA